jgi:hypothetical protein
MKCMKQRVDDNSIVYVYAIYTFTVYHCCGETFVFVLESVLSLILCMFYQSC